MLHEVSGDILLSRASVIAHGVSPNDAHDQGLALSLRENWPSMYKDFRHYCQTTHPKAGGVWAWAGADGKRVVRAQRAPYGQAYLGAAHGQDGMPSGCACTLSIQLGLSSRCVEYLHGLLHSVPCPTLRCSA